VRLSESLSLAVDAPNEYSAVVRTAVLESLSLAVDAPNEYSVVVRTAVRE